MDRIQDPASDYTKLLPGGWEGRFVVLGPVDLKNPNSFLFSYTSAILILASLNIDKLLVKMHYAGTCAILDGPQV